MKLPVSAVKVTDAVQKSAGIHGGERAHTVDAMTHQRPAPESTEGSGQ